MYSWLLWPRTYAIENAPSSSTPINYQPNHLEICKENEIRILSEKEMKSDLLCRPFYPSDQTLCRLAKITYEDKIKTLFDGWKLLKTGRNIKDGYFGAAFWHEENQQLVISHRGTKSMKAVVADIEGVVLNKLTRQLHSACTFAFLVLKELGTNNCSISITGHSLGGWLAQVSTFAVEYTDVTPNNSVSMIPDIKDTIYHPHTVAFDSPGCHEMLIKLSEYYFHRYGNKAGELISKLDITTYFLAPNLINAKNKHAGKLLFFDFKITYFGTGGFWSKIHSFIFFFLNLLKLNSFLPSIILGRLLPQTVNYHSLDNFLCAFNMGEKIQIYEVLNWPTFSILKTMKLVGSHTDELIKYSEFETLVESENFEIDLDSLNKESIEINFKIKGYDQTITKTNTFRENELSFLENWKKLMENKIIPSKINEFFSEKHLGKFDTFFPDFEIFKNEVKCNDRDSLEKIINLIKRLFVIFPHMNVVMTEQISSALKTFEVAYKTATDSYIRNLPKYHININFEDTIGLRDFLQNDACSIAMFRTKNTKDEAFRIRNILQQMPEYKNKYCLFHIKDAEFLKRLVDMGGVFRSSSIIDNLLVIDFGDAENDSILDFDEKLLQGTKKKIICITKKRIPINFNVVYKEIKEASMMDLSVTSQEALLNRKIISLPGCKLNLKDFLGNNQLTTLSDSLPFSILKDNFLTQTTMLDYSLQNYKFSRIFVNFSTIRVLKDVKIDRLENILKMCKSELEPSIEKLFENVKFLIIGDNENPSLKKLYEKYSGDEQIILKTSIDQDEGLKYFHDLCLENPKHTIFRLHMSNQEDGTLTWLDVFQPDLYIKRKFIITGNELDEKELIARNEKVYLISKCYGMDKSTALLNIAKNTPYNSWIFWINLIDAHQYLNASPNDLENVIKFLLRTSGNTSDLELAETLLKFSLKNQDSVPVYLFFDAFDEILYEYPNKDEQKIRKAILNMMKYLKDETTAKIFIYTTCYCEILEKVLKVAPIKLKGVEKKQEFEFCTQVFDSLSYG